MKIIVNGKEWNYPEDRPIDYDGVFGLAHPDMKGPYPKDFYITYRWKGEGDNSRKGQLERGATITPVDGMIFNCVSLGNA